jgi:hypothetical protein
MLSLLRITLTAIVAFLACRSHAYVPGPDDIRECPKCRTLFAQRNTASGNTFGATYWTDGRMYASMLPDRGAVLKCPKCSAAFFWLDARLVRLRLPGDEDGVADAAVPNEQDYLLVVQSTALVPEDELYARTRAWQSGNDAHRKDPTSAFELTGAQRENLHRIIKLADDSKLPDRLIKAEALRELGDFHACLELLADKEKLKDASLTARVIRNLATLRVRRVQIVGLKPAPPRNAQELKAPNKALQPTP